jgi:hypothetical protein
MSTPTHIVIAELAALFAPACGERATLDALARIARDPEAWARAHALVWKVRAKRVDATAAQCDFEDACARTLYNLSGDPGPFGADAPFRIVPAALALADRLGIDGSRVNEIVAGVG